MAYLARRDHGRLELATKLTAKGFGSVEINRVLDECETRGYLCDRKFADALLRAGLAKGHGIAKVRQGLVAKGLARELITEVLNASDVDWYAHAKAKALKKYGHSRVDDARERAKRIRYLAGQGFSFDEIAHALDIDPDDME